MTKKTRKTIDRLLGHECFGLNSEGDIEKLGERTVKVWVSVDFPSEEDWLFKFKLPKRRKVMAKWHKKAYKRIRAAVPLKKIKYKKGYLISSFTCELSAAHLVDLLKQPGNFNVYLKSVEGMKPHKPPQPPRSRPPREWYAVRARYAIQVEGATKGRQSYEDRIVLVQARSFKKAAKKFRKQEKNYEQPYLNSDGEMVRWHLERITYIYDTYLEKVDSEDTEVYSNLKTRRMKRKYEWHPHGKESGKK